MLRQKGPYSVFSSPQSGLGSRSGSGVEQENADEALKTAFSIDLTMTNEKEGSCTADVEIDGNNADTTDVVPSMHSANFQADYVQISDFSSDHKNESLCPHLFVNHENTMINLTSSLVIASNSSSEAYFSSMAQMKMKASRTVSSILTHLLR
ncbi:unnamed protein product [Rodentolepis nana]|uniref:Dimer_Tnp_hAT domain-containing protein n=1 Tax=Rodentolepis nana TaxID=102285 RepID=A0A0R3TZY7_RODNA|nr:unnamed protein product [Rodentolepis nana]